MLRDGFGDSLEGQIARAFSDAMDAGDGDPWEYADRVLGIDALQEIVVKAARWDRACMDALDD